MFFVILMIMFQYLVATTSERLVSNHFQRFDNEQDTLCKLYPVPADLIFLVDGSSNVAFDNFLKLKIFMGDVVNSFEISEDGLKVAVIQFASYQRTEFNLNSLKNKENTLTMLEMLDYINGTSKFIGKAIKYVSLNEFQTSKGSRKESNKIAVLLTDGFSQDDVKQASEQGRQLGVEYFVVTITEQVNYQELFEITQDLKEHVLKLNRYDLLISAIQNRLVRKRCDKSADTGALDVNNHVDYTVGCEKTRITVTVKTVTAFKGKIFIQGFAENQFCRQLQDAFAVNETTMLLMVPTNDCGVRAGYQLHPPGTYLEAKLVVSFHPVFITKMDQALNVRCFFSDNATQFNSLTFTKTDLRSKVFYPITPSCSYTIRLNSENGSTVSVVSVGQKVFHVWECGVELANFSMHVHSCSVDNGRETKSKVLDERGCSDDLELWPSVGQKSSRTKVWQEIESFKFSGPTLIYFTCRISFCDIDDIYCQRSYSPFVNCKSNKTIRSNIRIRSEDFNVDVYTRISVLESDGSEDFSTGNQAINSTNQPSLVCFNKVQFSLTLTFIFIIWIFSVSFYIIRVKIKGQIYVIYSNSKKRLMCLQRHT